MNLKYVVIYSFSCTYTWMRPAAGLRLFSKCFCLCCSWTLRAKPEPRMPCTDSEWSRETIKWSVTFTDLYRPEVESATTANCLLQDHVEPLHNRVSQSNVIIPQTFTCLQSFRVIEIWVTSQRGKSSDCILPVNSLLLTQQSMFFNVW